MTNEEAITHLKHIASTISPIYLIAGAGDALAMAVDALNELKRLESGFNRSCANCQYGTEVEPCKHCTKIWRGSWKEKK